MRKSLFYLVLSLIFTQYSFGQAGAVYTVAGGGSSTADGVPATSAVLTAPTGVSTDAFGNVYVADKSAYVVRRIDAGTGNIHTIAGNGTMGSAGDGGMATLAQLSSNLEGIHVDELGNVFIADGGKIRKVTAATGIISTVAGGGSDTAEGVAATSALLAPLCVYVDPIGNIYAGSYNKVMRVDAATGLIHSVAGGGSSLSEGIPATNASVGLVHCIKADGSGNLYIIEGACNKVRKIDVSSGLINTVVGGGTSSLDSIPATSVFFDTIRSCDVDAIGNIFIADYARRLIRRISAVSGVITTIVGTTSGGTSADGTPALSASITPRFIRVDPTLGRIFFSEFLGRVREVSFSSLAPFPGSAVGDSFRVYVNKKCVGAELTARTTDFYPGMTVRTYWGDGFADTSAVLPTAIGGYVLASHHYSMVGTFGIMQVLCHAGTPVDTITFSYHHIFCTEVPVRFFADLDLNCNRESTENLVNRATLTRVDSNGVPVDSITSLGGFNYLAYGSPGDIYTFTVVAPPISYFLSCPLIVTISDTLQTGVSLSPTHWVGLACSAATGFDLAAYYIVLGPGSHLQEGHIYVTNNYCFPTDATLTLSHSSKLGHLAAMPSPFAVTSTTALWNFSGLSSSEPNPRHIGFSFDSYAASLVFGDTVNSQVVITPTSGDALVANNTVIRVDTVVSSFDPNAIEVTPPACFEGDTTFQFTVHFQNVGNAPANNIYVMDTLSGNLDPSTLKFVTSSHQMFVTKTTSNGKTILRVDFPGINLPDSSNRDECNGMFIYTIRPLSSLATGSVITSRAGIYFDNNDVVVTNSVQNLKGCPPPISTLDFPKDEMCLYPNPVTYELTVATSLISGECIILNILGQEVMNTTLHSATQSFSVRELPQGVYTLQVRSPTGVLTGKFLKQ